MAGNLGFKVYLLRDATGTYEKAPAPGGNLNIKTFDAKTMHEVSMAELNEEFATVVTTDAIVQAVGIVGSSN
jgi:hypothetical protein